MFKYFCFFICCVCFTTSAFCEDLPIKLRQDSDKFTVINSSECIIYKLKVWSIPPEKEGVSNFFSRVGAELVGVGSFSALLGKIEKGDQIDFNRSDLTDSNGKKLTSDYKIGSLYFEGSACGECGLSVKFRAD